MAAGSAEGPIPGLRKGIRVRIAGHVSCSLAVLMSWVICLAEGSGGVDDLVDQQR
jgi:hypothetical protein